MTDDASHNGTPLQRRLRRLDERRRRLKDAGMKATHAQMAKRLGWSQSAAQRFFTGELVRVSADDEVAAARALDEMEAEAARRFGPGVLSDAPADAPASDPVDFPGPARMAGRIPVYGAVSAGGSTDLSHDSVIDWISIEGLFGGPAARAPFLLEITGASMEPRYLQGERVLVARGRPPKPGQDCVIEFIDGHAELKIYRRRAGGRIWADQWNTEDNSYQPEGLSFDAGEVKALHAAIGRID